MGIQAVGDVVCVTMIVIVIVRVVVGVVVPGTRLSCYD